MSGSYLSKSIGGRNFDEISQSTAELLLLPVSGNKRPPYWNSTSGFNSYLFHVIGMPLAPAYQMSSRSDHK